MAAAVWFWEPFVVGNLSFPLTSLLYIQFYRTIQNSSIYVLRVAMGILYNTDNYFWSGSPVRLTPKLEDKLQLREPSTSS